MDERLGITIQSYKNEQKIKGPYLHPQDDMHSHQQFLDDTLLMGHQSIKEAKAFNQILQDSMYALGMTINEEKSQISFFNTPLLMQRNITGIMGF